METLWGEILLQVFAIIHAINLLQRKKDEEARNSQTVPMDTELLEIFTIGTSGQSQIGGLDLGF
jgi:hypothetical protein